MPADPNRVRDVFLDAVELSPEERSGYLAEACRGDAELRAEVDRLLVANANPDSILEPASPITADATAAFIASHPGTVDLPGGTSATHASDPDAPSPTAIATEEYRPDGATEALDRPDPDATRAAASGAPAPRSARVSTGGEMGTVIAGRYTLLEVLGEGGMGTVYRAEQTATGQAAGGAQADQDRHGLARGAGPVRRRTPGAGPDGPPQHRPRLRRRQPPRPTSRSS